MPGQTLHAILASALSFSLITHGAPTEKYIALGHHGYTVALMQCNLELLGYHVGSRGTIDSKTISVLDQYVTNSGVSHTKTLSRQIADQVLSLNVSHPNSLLQTTVQTWLQGMGIGKGQALSKTHYVAALKTFQKDVGLSVTGQITGRTLELLAHLESVHIGVKKRWTYTVQSGDTLERMALASGLSVHQIEQDNNMTTSQIQKGQILNWKAPVSSHSHPSSSSTTKTPSTKTTSRAQKSGSATSPSSKTSKASAPTKTSSTQSPVVHSTGVFSNLQPVAALVVMEPSKSELSRLIADQKKWRQTLTIAVTGEWALTHPKVLRQAIHAGDGVALVGFSGANLNKLPSWGVKQELTWSQEALQSVLGQAPGFLIAPYAINARVSKLASSQGLVAMPTPITVSTGSTSSLLKTILSHPQKIISINHAVAWPTVLSDLSHRHFHSLSLGQIWANP